MIALRRIRDQRKSAEAKNLPKRGLTSLSEVLQEAHADGTISQMRISARLESLPGMGIAGSGHVRELSAKQRTALEDEYGQPTGAVGVRRRSHLSADHGVYFTAPTSSHTPDPGDEDEGDWDDDDVEPEEMPHPVEPEEMPHPVEPEEMPHPVEPEEMPHPVEPEEMPHPGEGFGIEEWDRP